MNLNEYRGILVFAEQREGILENVGLELIGKGKELAKLLDEKVTAVLLGHNIENLAKELLAYGADEVVVVDAKELAIYDTEAYTQAFSAIIKDRKPEIALVGATTIGRDLGPRISSRIQTGLTADCTSLEIGDNRELLMTRPAFGGNLMATIICPDHRPQMSTVRPGVMQKEVRNELNQGIISHFPVQFDNSKMKVKVLEIVKEEKEKVDISEANILVSAGRGVGNKENFVKLEAFANEINGIMSASRALVDSGIIGHDRQVGQTGKTVRPNLYFALGISGAIQHLAGMEESEYIIAINKDKYAPIFGSADLGIVADLNKVTPHLIEEIKKLKACR
ncbi:electron transfer flavoprotein subunit alpha/FixB family protein [Cetobacterium sp. 2A]|uniref:electron transfer flavoprotein subunit alpha/FixB family protein n=1 Tax=unclassified Cetobacterium TaxID=2630983 RepID=UPI00163CD242|nr:electron transfer flavoprotein subunit alpha/FixB family protein [Cetobacterium sp. 2A]MBC2857391.1 electron transfer flavoprotein subunit alpha/FixB family protein [Cetobacterium sp. 2A]